MSTRRHEEEIAQPIKRKVSLNPGGIAALDPGTNRIVDAWVEVDGSRVTEVEVGREFHILVEYISENVGGLTWLSCVTVKGDGIANYEDTKVWGSTIEHTARLGNIGPNVMPDKDITLRIKVWMHDNILESPPYPSEADW